ncbi:TetR/AcrR family transcriptional regulator [Micromonospora endolithica]|uniref:TetR/AcrR family transcriptional regulator n=1 Tax=Micromonospora endolithica TaxID=230091 RepID=A0A3A9ZQ17_9ACTN|nr:TetR/AcrR family transcriptional regulator [Micromonospora endolithica]RKN50322.1 TetR/AcrR family transcriptional regulator [Micromonospora endolithica]TWJ21020.1 TetR family transcriptional regulator [Micromonospora endolithica]
MPRLWTTTIEEHRRTVQAAVLDATADLVAQHGLTSVTMSQIAKATGIGRATLYKYFPDVEAIMITWHERQIGHHLDHLAAIGSKGGGPEQRLHAVLNAYATIQHGHRNHPLASLLHRGPHLLQARRHLRDFFAELLSEAAADGHVRDDIAPSELANYCLHALDAATELSTEAAVNGLVAVTVAGLRP